MKFTVFVALSCVSLVQSRTYYDYDYDYDVETSTVEPDVTDSIDDSSSELQYDLSEELEQDSTTGDYEILGTSGIWDWDEVTETTTDSPSLEDVSEGSAEELPVFKPLGKPKGLLDFADVGEYKLEWRKLQDE